MASRRHAGWRGWLLLGLVGGCAPAGGLEEGESDASSSGTNEGSEGIETTDADDTTAGRLDADESVMLVLHDRDELVGGEYLGFRVEDGQAEGPSALAPTSITPAEDAFELADHRVVFRSIGVHGDRYWLADVGGQWPADVEVIADARRPRDGRRPTPLVPGADALVLVADEETAVRVDLSDDGVGEPVAIARGVDGDLGLLVAEPLGRWVVFATKPDAEGTTALARASFEVPAPDVIDVLVETGIGETQQLVGFTPGGEGVFAFSGPADAPSLVYVDTTAAVAADPVEVHEPLGEDDFIAGPWAGLAPGAPGVAYMRGDVRSRDVELQYVGIEHGVPAMPITLAFGEPLGNEPIVWSPDGEWLVAGLAPQLTLARFADGRLDRSIEMLTADEGQSFRSYFAGDRLFVLRSSSGGVGNDLLRIQLDADGPGVPEVVVPYAPFAALQSVADISTDGDAVLYTALVDGAPRLFLIELDDDDASPVTIAAPEGDETVLEARFSPKGSFIAWSESAAEPRFNRVWLTARTAPVEATMVLEDVLDWRFATDR